MILEYFWKKKTRNDVSAKLYMEIVVLELHSLSVLHVYKYCSLLKTHIDSMYVRFVKILNQNTSKQPPTTLDVSMINT